MMLAYWCILAAGILPLACAYLAKFGPDDGSGRYDNHEPRVWLGKQGGRRGRANAAQANSFEALPLFAAGVIVAVLQHVPTATIDRFALVFIVARVIYIGLYVMNLAALRSLVWAIGFIATVGLFVAAAGAVG